MKRKLAAVLAVIITAFQVLPCSAFAEVEASVSTESAASEEKTETSQEDKMKAALAIVKSKITIPENYSEFSYSSGEELGMSRYTFKWTDPSDNSNYSAEVRGDIITRFSTPDLDIRYGSKPALSAHDSSYFVNKAMNWVYRVNPSMKGSLKKSEIYLSISSGTVDIYFSRQFADIPVNSNRVSVSLNKLTGEVVLFSADWWQGAEFKSAEDVLSQEAIKEIYCKEVTIKPQYRIYTDSETGKRKTNIVYSPLNSYVYNAFTGEHTEMNEDYDKYMDTDNYDRGVGLNGDVEDCEEEAVEAEDSITYANPATGVSFSEEELAAAADLSTMLTSAQFKELILKDPYMGVTEKYIMNNFKISSDLNAECGYSISCNMQINNKTEYRNVNITADAKSGRIMSFYSYDSSKAELNVKKANTLANAALKYYFGDIAGEYKSDPENTAPVSSDGKNKVTSREMRYHRYVNNIQVTNNSIVIGVNSAGKVTYIRSSHERNVDFGDGLIINKETALKLLCEQKDIDLRYEGFTDLNSVPHTYLHYSMENWCLNAVNGKLCDYNGNPIDDPAEKISDTTDCPYTDLADSPYKREIETLYAHGVKLYEGDKFMPGKKMTRAELKSLLGIIKGYGYEPMPLEERAPEEGSVESAESGQFTRMELAKEFTKAAKVDNVAKYTAIFKSPFSDVSETDKNVGYAALAYGMGAISGGKDGKFYPNAFVTREYAYHCAYNYIKNNSES